MAFRADEDRLRVVSRWSNPSATAMNDNSAILNDERASYNKILYAYTAVKNTALQNVRFVRWHAEFANGL